MNICESCAALLDPYIDGELTPDESARVREHLEHCSGCRAYVEAALSIRDAFPAAGETEVPDGFAEGVMAAIRAGAAPRKKRRPPWVKVVLPLAACFAVVVLAQGLVRGGWPAAGGTPEAAPKNASQDRLGDLACAVDGCGDISVDAPSPSSGTESSPAENGAAAPPGADRAPVLYSQSPPETAEDSSQARPSGGTGKSADVPESETESAGQDGAAEAAVPPPGVGLLSHGEEPTFLSVRISAHLAGYLPEGREPVSTGEDGAAVYALTADEYDALAEALAEAGETPEILLSAPENRDAPGARALVTVSGD